jgi:hypothetical protein
MLMVAVSALAAPAALGATTPGWECIPTTAGQAVVSGGTAPAPSCAAATTPVLAPTYVSSGVGGKPTVQFSAVNVQVVSGSGSTSATPTGEGNLVVGYAENTAGRAQTGSNDLVVGSENSWKSYGEIVGGFKNVGNGKYATAVGDANTAAGAYSLAAGALNKASGIGSSAIGGDHNETSGEWSSVSGGEHNSATAPGSSILGDSGETENVADAAAGVFQQHFPITIGSATIAGTTCLRSALTIGGVQSGDIPMWTKTSTDLPAGLLFETERVLGANQVQGDFCNVSGSTLSEPGNEAYTYESLR